MLTIVKLFAAAWFVLIGVGGRGGSADDAGEEPPSSGGRLLDWLSKIFAVIGAVYLFRDVYQDVAALVNDEGAAAATVANDAIGDRPREDVAEPDPAPAPQAGEPAPDAAAAPGAPVGGLDGAAEPDASALVALFGDLAYADYPAWAAVITLALISATLAMMRGIQREALRLALWVAAIAAAVVGAAPAAQALADAPFIGEQPAELRGFIAFLGLLLGVLILGGWLLRLVLPRGPRTPGVANSFFGFLFGAARGVLLSAVLAVVLAQSGARWPALDTLTQWAPVEAAVDGAIDALAERSDVVRLLDAADDLEP